MAVVAAIAALAAAAVGIYSAVDSSNKSKKNKVLADTERNNAYITEKRRYAQEKADNLENWNRQNAYDQAYNSPEAQMNRYRQAGLNPHLIYGKNAESTVSSIAPAKHGLVNRVPGSYSPTNVSGIANAIGQYQDTNLKVAQTDNVNQSTALMQQEAILKQATTAKTVQETAKSKFDLEQASALKDDVITAAKLQNEKLKQDTQYTVDENQRKALQSTSDLKMTAEKILSEKLGRAKTRVEIDKIKEDIEALKQSEDIKQYHQKLTEMGIGPNDPWYFRGLMNMVHGNLSIPSWMQGIYDKFGSGQGGTFNNHRSIQKNKGASGNW